MTFGPGKWGADEATSQAIFDAYRSAGGNFIDTADIYSGGESERLVGNFIGNSGVRDEIVLATKFAFNGSANPLAAKQAGGGNPNAGGAGAKNIHRALDASLKRLRSDYIDLYWLHIWDGITPVEEIIQTLGDLVRAGKIRYFGLSDMPAWLAMKAATIAVERRDLKLSGDQMKRLDEASAPLPGFSSGLAAPAIRRMVFGGHDVLGWGEL